MVSKGVLLVLGPLAWSALVNVTRHPSPLSWQHFFCCRFPSVHFCTGSTLRLWRYYQVFFCFFLVKVILPPLERFIVWIDGPASTLPTSETTCWRFLAAVIAAAGLEQRPLARLLDTTDGRSQEQNHNYQLKRTGAFYGVCRKCWFSV